MRQPVGRDRRKGRIGQDDFIRAHGCRVALISRLDICPDQRLDLGQFFIDSSAFSSCVIVFEEIFHRSDQGIVKLLLFLCAFFLCIHACLSEMQRKQRREKVRQRLIDCIFQPQIILLHRSFSSDKTDCLSGERQSIS